MPRPTTAKITDQETIEDTKEQTEKDLLEIASNNIFSPEHLTVQTLVVPYSKFEKCLQLDLKNYISTNPFNNAEYLNYAAALKFLKKEFPTFVVKYKLNEEGHPYFITEVGSFVKCYMEDLATGLTSEELFFPVMVGKDHRSVGKADARQFSDAMNRAACKLIAQVTGIGFTLWLRVEEDVIKNLGKSAEDIAIDNLLDRLNKVAKTAIEKGANKTDIEARVSQCVQSRNEDEIKTLGAELKTLITSK